MAINYLCTYIIIVVPLFLLFWGPDIKSFFMPERRMWGARSRVSMLVLVLSLGGIPPFLGFFPKIFSIFCLFQISFLIVVLIMASIVTIYVYLNVFFCGFFRRRAIGEKSLERLPSYYPMVIVGTIRAGIFQVFMCLSNSY